MDAVRRVSRPVSVDELRGEPRGIVQLPFKTIGRALTISKAAELLHRKETNYDSIAGVCDDRTSHNVATVQ